MTAPKRRRLFSLEETVVLIIINQDQGSRLRPKFESVRPIFHLVAHVRPVNQPFFFYTLNVEGVRQ